MYEMAHPARYVSKTAMRIIFFIFVQLYIRLRFGKKVNITSVKFF